MAITTAKVRASYVHIFQPRTMEGSTEAKYSVTLLIPKSDTHTLNTIYAEIEKVKQESAQKVFGGHVPPGCRIPIYDGDGLRPSGEQFGEECRGHMVMAASAKQQPAIVDLGMQAIINPAEVYSGCYIRANINFFAYNTSGNKGIGCALNGVQKIEDGEPLTMRMTPEEAFGGNNTYTGAPSCAPGATGMPYQMPPYQTAPQAGYGYQQAPPQQAPQYQLPPQQAYPQQGAAIDPITGRPALPGGVMGV